MIYSVRPILASMAVLALISSTLLADAYGRSSSHRRPVAAKFTTHAPAASTSVSAAKSSPASSGSLVTSSVLNINTMTKAELRSVTALSSDAMWMIMNFRTPFGYADTNAFATQVCSRISLNFGTTDIQIGSLVLAGFQCAKGALSYQANGSTYAYALPVELTGSSTVPVAPPQ